MAKVKTQNNTGSGSEAYEPSRNGRALTLEPNWDDLTREEEAQMVEADGDLRSAVESLGATFREIVVRTKCNNDRMRRNRGEIKHRALALIEQAKVLAGRC